MTGGYTTGYQRWANTAPGTTRHCVFERDWQSAVVQWLGYLAFTQETRVQTPAAEILSDQGYHNARLVTSDQGFATRDQGGAGHSPIAVSGT